MNSTAIFVAAVIISCSILNCSNGYSSECDDDGLLPK